jgi:hypothetical protein
VFISLKMNEGLNVGWWPEGSEEPLDEEFDIVLKQRSKRPEQGSCHQRRRMLELRTR